MVLFQQAIDLGETPPHTHFLLPVAAYLPPWLLAAFSLPSPTWCRSQSLTWAELVMKSGTAILCLSLPGSLSLSLSLTVTVLTHHPPVFRPEGRQVFCWGLSFPKPLDCSRPDRRLLLVPFVPASSAVSSRVVLLWFTSWAFRRLLVFTCFLFSVQTS